MHLFDRGFVGRLLCDGLEQVAAEVIQPNLEPVERNIFQSWSHFATKRRASLRFRTIVDWQEFQSIVETANGLSGHKLCKSSIKFMAEFLIGLRTDFLILSPRICLGMQSCMLWRMWAFKLAEKLEVATSNNTFETLDRDECSCHLMSVVFESSSQSGVNADPTRIGELTWMSRM